MTNYRVHSTHWLISTQVVALRRGRRVAQLGPRSPDYLSGEAVYASLADMRSRRLAEMVAHCVE